MTLLRLEHAIRLQRAVEAAHDREDGDRFRILARERDRAVRALGRGAEWLMFLERDRPMFSMVDISEVQTSMTPRNAGGPK